MKKIFSVFALLSLLLFLEGCDKTEVENDLNQARENEEILTKEEAEALKEDPEFKEDFLEELTKAVEEQKIEEDYNLVRELEKSEDKKMDGKAKGSCDAIGESSTCIEYYGSFWTDLQMKLQCEGAGTFSKKPCPRDFAGGCNTGMGTEADMVAWMYLRGGGEITAESLKYAKMACDATMVSKWLTTR